jgi:hypothetical protein
MFLRRCLFKLFEREKTGKNSGTETFSGGKIISTLVEPIEIYILYRKTIV